MADLIHLVLTGGSLPKRGGEKPHLNLILSPDLESASADGGTTFGSAAVRQHACDPDVIPIGVDDTGIPLNVGRKRRLINLGQRRALIARDGGCAFPGCHLPPRWTDAHHIKHWFDGGNTDLVNLVLLCRRHHTLLHRTEWTIDVIDGIPYFTPPRWVDPQQKPRRNLLRQEPARDVPRWRGGSGGPR